ncbi:MAG: preprotein translocase subunit SecA [Planctomycetales bacterium]
MTVSEPRIANVSPTVVDRAASWVGGPVRRRMARWKFQLPRINAFAEKLKSESEEDLRKRSLSLRYRAKCGEPLDHLLPEAFALAREASDRTLGMRHYDVQLLGGVALHDCCVAEMQTGEGKTLTAVLPLCLQAMSGRGAHLATANDYLAKRDAEWMKPVYEMLGLTVGVIQSQMPGEQRREAYASDITYGTAKEFGFDFLRDQLLLRMLQERDHNLLARLIGESSGQGEKPLMRPLHFIVVDEADSLMIDDARTPLIISALPTSAEEAKTASFRWAAEVQDQFGERTHYDWDHEKRKVDLTAEGRRFARSLAKPDAMGRVTQQMIYEYVEQALLAAREFHREDRYIVRDGEIVIIDESTGRAAEGRKWRDGLHQAIEAKEKVEVTVDSGQAARVTIQDFFMLYEHLSGMTGTAVQAAREFRKIYHLRTAAIPTHRPSQRKQLPPRVFRTEQAKWNAVVEEVRSLCLDGRPVLIGTRSIDKSQVLSELLREARVAHQVLNAYQVEQEAAIVSDSGQRSRVTVSTNMAGRGTDINLGEGIAELGGLHVICTEMHDSARIDRQLIGRSARQGDPGTYRLFLSLEDEVLRSALGPEKQAKLIQAGNPAQETVDSKFGAFRRAQRSIERKHFQDRKILLYHERERKKLQIQMGQNPYLDSPS